MNASQRKYLIDKVKKQARNKIEELREQKEDLPAWSHIVHRAIMEGELQIKSEEEILKTLEIRALTAEEGKNWLSGQRMGHDKSTSVRMDIHDLLVIPDKYIEMRKAILARNAEIEQKVKEIEVQRDTLEMRITLARPATLEKVINEIDDMGELSLLDTKLRIGPAKE